MKQENLSMHRFHITSINNWLFKEKSNLEIEHEDKKTGTMQLKSNVHAESNCNLSKNEGLAIRL